MSETDLARSWKETWPRVFPRGGEAFMPEANENEGRGPTAALLSARDLSCSDQLNPWSERAEGGYVSVPAREEFILLA